MVDVDRTEGTMVALEQVRTLPQLAEELGLPYSTLAQWAREGRIPAKRLGRLWVSTREQVLTAIRHTYNMASCRWRADHRAELYPDRVREVEL